MRFIPFILTLISAVMICSCSADAYDLEPDFIGVVGTVTDTEGNPIDHIRITLKWDGIDENFVSYSSSEGIFKTAMDFDPTADGSTTLHVTLEDIDGEKNGGLYEKKTDTIRIEPDKSEKPFRIKLVYRLTLATASESSPQS